MVCPGSFVVWDSGLNLDHVVDMGALILGCLHLFGYPFLHSELMELLHETKKILIPTDSQACDVDHPLENEMSPGRPNPQLLSLTVSIMKMFWNG